MDLSNVFSRWASESSKEVYLEKDGRKLSPQLIWSQASCLATGLVGLGLLPGEGVAVWMRSVPEVAVAYIATQLAGGCFVPVNRAWDREYLVKMIVESKSSLAIISLDLYDQYVELESKLKSVRELIVDAGEASAETTLPSDARSLTPMLMVGRDVTLPDIEPKTRTLYYVPEGADSPAETFRAKERWARAIEAAEGAFKRGELILNAVDLIQPEALLLGVIWPLLAGASVVICDAKDGKIAQIMEEKKPDTLLLDTRAASAITEKPTDAKVSRVMWIGAAADKESERLSKLFDTQARHLRDEVNSADFLF